MGKNIIVVDKEEQKKHFTDYRTDAQVITAKEYLTESSFKKRGPFIIYNLSKSIDYQGIGYYVSLLAMARKHKVYPDLTIIQDLKLIVMQKYYSSELDDLVQKKLSALKGDAFELSVYFGRNLAKNYDPLCKQLTKLVKAPLFRVSFVKDTKWHLKSIKLLSLDALSPVHLNFMMTAAEEYFFKRQSFPSRPKPYLYDLAILYNPEERLQSSNPKAIQKFVKAGRKLGLRVELIGKKDLNRVLEYDALFIRETTNVNHYTYRISRMAEAEGLVVIDDPDSILKCTNKVFLEEVLETAHVRRPKSIIFEKGNYRDIARQISYPCVIKQPDSAFSQGVFKAKDSSHFLKVASRLFKISDLLITQEYIPTEFDWRIGILNNKVLFVCKYYMAKNHWQILKNEQGKTYDGEFETLNPELVPQKVLKTALKVASKIGNGLYGIDLKQKEEKVYVIEINDNPNIDSGVEDQFLGELLYEKVMTYFIQKLNEKHHVSTLSPHLFSLEKK